MQKSDFFLCKMKYITLTIKKTIRKERAYNYVYVHHIKLALLLPSTTRMKN